jgi:HAE1 family hydrophobic/amphiphilic exporter-1
MTGARDQQVDEALAAKGAGESPPPAL